MIRGFARTHKEDIGGFRIEIKKLYEAGMTVAEIARRVNRHHSTVIHALKGLNIILPTRKVSSSRAYKDQPMKLSITEHIGADKRIYGQNYKKLLDRSGIKPSKEYE